MITQVEKMQRNNKILVKLAVKRESMEPPSYSFQNTITRCSEFLQIAENVTKEKKVEKGYQIADIAQDKQTQVQTIRIVRERF